MAETEGAAQVKTLTDDASALPHADSLGSQGGKAGEAPLSKGVLNGQKTSGSGDDEAGAAEAAGTKLQPARTSSSGIAGQKSGDLGAKKSGDLGARKSGDLGALSPTKSLDKPTVLTSRTSSDASAAVRKSSDAGAASNEATGIARKSSDAGAASKPSSSTTPAPITPGTKGSLTSAGSGSVPLRTSSSGAKVLSPATSSASAAALAEERRPSAALADDLPDGSAPKVKALREQLSQVRQHMSMSTARGEKRQNGTVMLSGGVAQPVSPEPKPEGPAERRLSEHDKVNTTNALELLQSGAFKLVPGKDSVPYEKLITLRLEDGIDVTRKEEYLSAEEFSTILKMDRAAFTKLPQWKRLQLKKSTQLF